MPHSPVFDFRKSSVDSKRVFYTLAKPVFFVGFMGAGKTSTVRKLARLAGVSAADTDMFIERYCNMTVSEIFSELGEEGFRSVETDVLFELATGEPCLVSCGGGIVLKPQNCALMRKYGFVVYLRVTVDEAASRISDYSSRPLFGDSSQATQIIQMRQPLYEKIADITVDTNDCGSNSIAHTVFLLLKKEGMLWQQK